MAGRRPRAALQHFQALPVQVADAAGETSQIEQADVVAGLPPLGQVGHDLADDAGELVAVAGEAGGEGHLRVVGMQVDDEVAVG